MKFLRKPIEFMCFTNQGSERKIEMNLGDDQDCKSLIIGRTGEASANWSDPKASLKRHHDMAQNETVHRVE